jgi:membrane protease subunit (stomatin/prohibitin family)
MTKVTFFALYAEVFSWNTSSDIKYFWGMFANQDGTVCLEGIACFEKQPSVFVKGGLYVDRYVAKPQVFATINAQLERAVFNIKNFSYSHFRFDAKKVYVSISAALVTALIDYA